MPDNIGPHLLGRKPSPPDERDYKLENFLFQTTPESDAFDQINVATTELKLTTVTFKKWASSSYPDVTTTHWWKAFNALAKAQSDLMPVIPTGVKEWNDPNATLDQGDTPHCVGFGWAQWGNTDPVNDEFVDSDGHDIYYECKVIDGEPGAEDGSDVRSGAQAMKNRSRLGAYAFASSLDTALTYLETKSPVVVGSDWTDDMFNPDSNGIIHPTGSIAGGHCYLMIGYDPATQLIEFLNSWGSSWAKNGRFYMPKNEFNTLFQSQGELCTAIELALAV